MTRSARRRFYPAGLVAVFGVTIFYLSAMTITGIRLRDIESGRIDLSVIGIPIFVGERAGSTSSVAPAWGFVVVSLVFVMTVVGTWIVSGRRRPGDDRD